MRRLIAIGSLALAAWGCETASSAPGQASSEPATPSASASSLEVAAPTASASATPAPTTADCWKTNACPAAKGAAFSSSKKVDVLIAGGTVIDGKSPQPMRADVVIDDGKIVHVGSVEGVEARTRIDAKGKVVTPGFIDTHAHADPALSNTSYLAMGVTSVCVGQDGRSPSDDRIRYWRNRVGKKRFAVNIVPFVGHGTLRQAAKIGLSKTPSEKQIARMARYVGKAMDLGAWGLTTGLEYRPGTFATTKELIAIAKPVAEHDGVIMSHMRSEDDDAIEAALDELLAQGKEGGARVHVSHIKVVYGKGEKRAEQILAKLDAARKDGVKVTADIYPYNASYTTINIVFPDFALPPHKYDRVKREKREKLEQFLRDKIEQRGGPDATLFGTDPWRGQTLKEVADKASKPFEDVLIDDVGPGSAAAAYFVMDDALQSRLLLDPHVMVATDGSATSRHPRGYGTFAKVIRLYVMERGVLPLGEAIRKMSGLPAETVGLTRIQRGLLKKDWAADVLVFDPREVKDRADYENPNNLAEGMSWVFVNGVATIAEGDRKKRRGGKLILRPKE
jgi:N-acyl-D-aspartate/D-glutamate deacylase